MSLNFVPLLFCGLIAIAWPGSLALAKDPIVQADTKVELPQDAAYFFSSDINTQQQQQIKRWLDKVRLGMVQLLGPMPAPYEIHLQRRSSRNSPVPWAHTRKGERLQVHLFIDLSHSWQDFAADWTAPHELAHMIFPYLGSDDRWFAEGVATYLQYPIMYASGDKTWRAVAAKMAERFDRVRRSRVDANLSVLEHNNQLGVLGDYPRLYWGGAAYFARADYELYQRHGLRLFDVIRRYSACCYDRWTSESLELIDLFDELSDSTVFREVYNKYMMTPGTPPALEILEWIRTHPPTIAAVSKG